jgi:hypothetical protein
MNFTALCDFEIPLLRADAAPRSKPLPRCLQLSSRSEAPRQSEKEFSVITESIDDIDLA